MTQPVDNNHCFNDRCFNDQCSICLEDFAETAGSVSHTLPCGHRFHVQCIVQSFRKSNECPNCRDTAGHPRTIPSSVNNIAVNGTGHVGDDTYDDELEGSQEYADFLDIIRQLRFSYRNDKTYLKLKTAKQNLIQTSREMRRSSNAVGKEFISATAQVYNKLSDEFKNSEEYKNMRTKIRDFRKYKAVTERSVRRLVRKYMDDNGLLASDELAELTPLIRKYVSDSVEFQPDECFALRNVSMFIY